MKRVTQTTQDFSLDSLKGMQSVRATFKLPKKTINLLSTIANQIGVKQKSENTVKENGNLWRSRSSNARSSAYTYRRG